METIKELEAEIKEHLYDYPEEEVYAEHNRRTKIQALKDVLELIDEFLTPNRKSKGYIEFYELEELKARITG